jgi:hypothetical protein
MKGNKIGAMQKQLNRKKNGAKIIGNYTKKCTKGKIIKQQNKKHSQKKKKKGL